MTTPALVPIPRATLARVVSLAIEEDLGRGDVTTSACVPRAARGVADFIAREPLVLAGLDVVREVFRQVDPALVLTALREDGERLARTDIAARVEGAAASILEAERVALNFLQRMSGVATLTRTFVDALPAGSRTRVTDTRKTTPGLRALERWAVRAGGGHNHREDLSAAVLIKDNHIAAAGGLTRAVDRARVTAPHTSRVEVEVDSFELLDEALAARADVIMLDDAKAAAAAGAVAGHVVIADQQTAGRGSRGRTWESPPGDDLYISIVDRVTLPPDRLPPLTLAVGLGVARAVEALAPGVRAEVKWPNDVWIDGRKCAGILVEGVTRGSRTEALVIGIGLDVNRTELPPELHATSLALASGKRIDRAVALTRLLLEVERAVDTFAADGLAETVREVEARLALRGERIEVDDLTGTLIGLTADGALTLHDDTGTLHTLHSGTLRRAP